MAWITINLACNCSKLEEQLRNIHSMLLIIKEETEALQMIPSEVQALMDEAKKLTDIGPALDSGFKAMAIQIGALQNQVAAMQTGVVLTDADKLAIQGATSELASTFSTLQNDIPSGTGVTPAPAPSTGAVSTDPTLTDLAPSTGTVSTDPILPDPAPSTGTVSTDPAPVG